VRKLSEEELEPRKKGRPPKKDLLEKLDIVRSGGKGFLPTAVIPMNINEILGYREDTLNVTPYSYTQRFLDLETDVKRRKLEAEYYRADLEAMQAMETRQKYLNQILGSRVNSFNHLDVPKVIESTAKLYNSVVNAIDLGRKLSQNEEKPKRFNSDEVSTAVVVADKMLNAFKEGQSLARGSGGLDYSTVKEIVKTEVENRFKDLKCDLFSKLDRLERKIDQNSAQGKSMPEADFLELKLKVDDHTKKWDLAMKKWEIEQVIKFLKYADEREFNKFIREQLLGLGIDILEEIGADKIKEAGRKMGREVKERPKEELPPELRGKIIYDFECDICKVKRKLALTPDKVNRYKCKCGAEYNLVPEEEAPPEMKEKEITQEISEVKEKKVEERVPTPEVPGLLVPL